MTKPTRLPGERQMNSYHTTDFQVRRKSRRTKMSVVRQVNPHLPLALTMLVLSLWGTSAMAQTEVRPYPDPGHRWLGVYGGGPEQHFDYFLRKLSLGDTFPDKAAWWAGVKPSPAGRDNAHRHDVLTVYCGERDADLETGKRRLDAWLAAEKDCPTYPELIPAICLGEENTGGRVEVLDGLARHVREKYGIPVFQWHTDPFPPDPNLTADGWIWDSYGWDRVGFRKHLMKFVALGKPAICVPWATDPHWPQWTQYPTTEALINREWHQFDTAREFNVSCAAFAVAGPTGSVNHWMGSETADMVQLRAALRLKREEMHDTRPGTLPLSSANYSVRDRSVPVGGDRDAPSVYEESFSGFQWLHDADVRGFLGLKLTSRPEEPGFLALKTKSGETSRASLVYRFESYFPLESVEVTLDATAPTDARCRNTLAISTDEPGRDWPLEVTQDRADKIDSLRLGDEGSLKGRHVFFVRVAMENAAQQAGLAGNRLDRLRVRCEHQPPQADAVAQLSSDLYGNLTYEDDFTTKRWQHLGRLDVGHQTHGGYRDRGFWVGMKGGFATSTQLVQRISSPQPLKQLVVMADCSANGPSLGGSITLSVGPLGEKPKWDVQTQGVHNGSLKLEVPAGELGSLQDFDVHMTLHSSSGVENGDKACATLSKLTIQAKGE